MNHKASPETKDRALALFALAATDAPQATDCPSQETLAQFIDGQLKGQSREVMLAHLNRCRPCYHHWLEVASHVAAEDVPRPPQTESGAPVWQRLTMWFGDWNIAVPVAASAVLIFAVILWWPVSPELNAEIDLAYAELSVQPSARRARTPSPPLPWEAAALGFSESQASTPRRAFGSGLWAGKRALFGADKETLPAFLSPPGGVAWLKTEWADYHTLGRWMMLVWALTVSDRSKGDWNEQAAIGQRLLSELSKGGREHEEEAQRAKAALERLKPLLSALESAANPRSRAELRRAVEIAMQQLAP